MSSVDQEEVELTYNTSITSFAVFSPNVSPLSSTSATPIPTPTHTPTPTANTINIPPPIIQLTKTICGLEQSNISLCLPSNWHASAYIILSKRSRRYLIQTTKKLFRDQITNQIPQEEVFVSCIHKSLFNSNEAISSFFKLFYLPIKIYRLPPVKRLEYAKSTIREFITLTFNSNGIIQTNSILFMLNNSWFTTKIANETFRKLNHIEKVTHRPRFIIQIQGYKNIYIILWINNVNVCSFNLSKSDGAGFMCKFSTRLSMFIKLAMMACWVC